MASGTSVQRKNIIEYSQDCFLVSFFSLKTFLNIFLHFVCFVCVYACVCVGVCVASMLEWDESRSVFPRHCTGQPSFCSLRPAASVIGQLITPAPTCQPQVIISDDNDPSVDTCITPGRYFRKRLRRRALGQTDNRPS